MWEPLQNLNGQVGPQVWEPLPVVVSRSPWRDQAVGVRAVGPQVSVGNTRCQDAGPGHQPGTYQCRPTPVPKG